MRNPERQHLRLSSCVQTVEVLADRRNFRGGLIIGLSKGTGGRVQPLRYGERTEGAHRNYLIDFRDPLRKPPLVTADPGRSIQYVRCNVFTRCFENGRCSRHFIAIPHDLTRHATLLTD